MFRITPYTSTSLRKNGFRDAFDVFDEFFNESKYSTRDFKIDVKDLENEYEIIAELPGLKREEIQIHYENEKLTISVNKEENIDESNDKFIHRERYSSRYERSIYLKDVDPKKMTAKLEDGILVVHATKSEQVDSKFLIDIE